MSLTVQTVAVGIYPSIALPVDNLARTYTYDVNGVIETVSVTYNAIVYTKTFTFTDGFLTNTSQWTPPA